MKRHRQTGNPRGRPKKETEKAYQWLKELLSLGDKRADWIEQTVKAKAHELGFSWSTLRDLKGRYGIRSYRTKGDSTGVWYWSLKSAPEIAVAQSPFWELPEAQQIERMKPMSDEDLRRELGRVISKRQTITDSLRGALEACGTLIGAELDRRKAFWQDPDKVDLIVASNDIIKIREAQRMILESCPKWFDDDVASDAFIKLNKAIEKLEESDAEIPF